MRLHRRMCGVLLALAMTACGESHSADDSGADASPPGDAGVPQPDAASDGGPPDPRDAGVIEVDAAVATDAGATPDAGAIPDAGPVTCEPSSCESSICGRSYCGYPCGGCPEGSYCTPDGTCNDATPPGAFCIDAFRENVSEGARSFRVCPVDPTQFQSCMCSGGGADAWIACGDCQAIRVDAPRGARCDTDAQCGGGVSCHPTIRLCGERCDRGLGTVCPGATACGIPGDVAGACLPSCAACGGSCSEWQACRAGDDGDVCVPNDYGWAPGC